LAQNQLTNIYVEVASYDLSDAQDLKKIVALARNGNSGEIVFSGNSIIASDNSTLNWSVGKNDWNLELSVRPIVSSTDSLAIKVIFHQASSKDMPERFFSNVEYNSQIRLEPKRRHIILATEQKSSGNAMVVAVIRAEPL
jgi:hypothetical protein